METIYSKIKVCTLVKDETVKKPSQCFGTSALNYLKHVTSITFTTYFIYQKLIKLKG